MKQFWKNKAFWIAVLKTTVTLTVVTGAVILMSFVDKKKYKVYCHKLSVNIDYGDSPRFVFEKGVIEELNKLEGNLVGKPANMIRVDRIEDHLKRNPYIKNVDVFTSTDGDLFVNIQQRRAIIRVINVNNQSTYLDEDGVALPFYPDLPYRFTLATGNIFFSYGNISDTADKYTYLTNRLLMEKLVKLAKSINNNPFMKALTEQIYVQDISHFELYPKIGGHLILIGDVDKLTEKFSNLLAFYEEGITKIGWENCAQISLINNNQVVCKIKKKNGIQ